MGSVVVQGGRDGGQPEQRHWIVAEVHVGCNDSSSRKAWESI